MLKNALQRRWIRCWLLLLGTIIALMCFEEVVDDVFFDPLEGDLQAKVLDSRIRDIARTYRTPITNQVMVDITSLGSLSVMFTLLFILLSILMTYKDYKGMSYLFTISVGAGLWPLLLKPYFGRARPTDIEPLAQVMTLSFPSGHSFGAAAIYIGLAYYAGKYARSWYQELFFYLLGATLVLLVCVSRIYLGVHYTTDVLGGLSAGAAWAFFISLLYEFARHRSTLFKKI